MKILFIFTFTIVCGFGSLAQTENYWTVKSDFGGLKRERAISFTALGKGYVGMGVDTAEIVHNDLWSYDAVLDTWAQVASMPGVPRRDAIAFSINEKGYVGTGNTQPDSWLGVDLSDFWEYNPLSNSWTQKANFPQAIYFATGFSVGSKGYVCGGKLGSNFYSAQLYEYNPVTDQWSPRASFPGGVRYQLSSFVVNDKAYVGLGTDQDMYRKDLWEYNPSVDQWVQRSDLPASERANSHAFSIGNRGFICMGSNGGYLDDLWEYNPSNDSWAVRATYGGSKRKNGVAFTSYGRAYVGTGKGYDGKKSSIYEYVPGAWVGLEENALTAVNIYPNPASEIVHIQSNSTEIERLEMYALTGELILSSSWTNEIHVGNFAAGSYLLVAKNQHGEIIGNEKLIVR